MGIDNEIVVILKAHTWVNIDKPVIFNQKGNAFKKMPWVQVSGKGKVRNYSEPDLTGKFKRRQYPFSIEIKGRTDDDMIAVQDDIEDALDGLGITNGWYEINNEMEEEDSQGKLQSIILEGFKILYK